MNEQNWHALNQRYLVAALAALGATLEAPLATATNAEAEAARIELAASMRPPPALDVITELFGLSPFERDILLLCAGVELDSAFAARCAKIMGEARPSPPSFSMALASLPGAHWSAVGPGRPLRRFHLIEVARAESLARGPLRVDERVLHYITGVDHPDERLTDVVERAAAATLVAPSHSAIARRAAAVIAAPDGGQSSPIVLLYGADGATRWDIASAASASVGVPLLIVDAGLVAARSDIGLIGRVLAREAILTGSALLIDVDEDGAAEPARFAAIRRLIDRHPGPVLVSANEKTRLGRRPSISIEVKRPSAVERRAAWTDALAAAPASDLSSEASAPMIDALAEQFDLDPSAIRSVCASVAQGEGRGGRDVYERAWDACRAETRADLEGLAQRIEPSAGWDALVLPPPILKLIREIANSLRSRAKVHGAWGFAERDARGLGVGALFAGPSGTGKTLAAEVLAADLRLDLYRVDLSQLVSKYIGETEKNLRRVFDAAERAASILLFDEADALFGRRGEVKDSNDRYANLEIAYLLQRMEAYRGLAILTSNIERSIDPAFLRRLRFVVRFPLPGSAERAALWRRVFPAKTPTEGLDVERLAQLNLTGGSIRNIALRAAFLAAEAGGPVRMDHIFEAAQAEYDKLGRLPGKSESF